MKVLSIDDQDISDARMRSISAKTMVIIGDADAVKPEHALAMFTLIGDQVAASGGEDEKGRWPELAGSGHLARSG